MPDLHQQAQRQLDLGAADVQRRAVAAQCGEQDVGDAAAPVNEPDDARPVDLADRRQARLAAVAVERERRCRRARLAAAEFGASEPGQRAPGQ
jgi:hypothetical protein